MLLKLVVILGMFLLWNNFIYSSWSDIIDPDLHSIKKLFIQQISIEQVLQQDRHKLLNHLIVEVPKNGCHEMLTEALLQKRDIFLDYLAERDDLLSIIVDQRLLILLSRVQKKIFDSI